VHEGVYEQYEQHQQDGEAHDEQAKAVRTYLEGRWRRLTGKGVGDCSDGGIGPRSYHQHPSAAADDGSAHEHGVVGILQIGGVGAKLARPLFHGIGLTRQQGLLDEKIACFQHPTISGDQIASGEHHDVAGDHFRYRHLQRLAVAYYGGAHRNRVAQAFRRFAGAVLLNEIQGDA